MTLQPSFREFGGPPGPLQAAIILAFARQPGQWAFTEEELAQIVSASSPYLAPRVEPASILGAISGMKHAGRAWIKNAGAKTGWRYILTPKGFRLARILQELEDLCPPIYPITSIPNPERYLPMTKPKFPVGSIVTIQVKVERITENYYVTRDLLREDHRNASRQFYFKHEDIVDVVSLPLQVGEKVSVPGLTNGYVGTRFAGEYLGTLGGNPEEGVVRLSGGERIIRPLTDIQRT